jgi:hypothetical protein
MPVSLCRFAYLINLTIVQILPLYNVLAVTCIISDRSLGYSCVNGAIKRNRNLHQSKLSVTTRTCPMHIPQSTHVYIGNCVAGHVIHWLGHVIHWLIPAAIGLYLGGIIHRRPHGLFCRSRPGQPDAILHNAKHRDLQSQLVMM